MSEKPPQGGDAADYAEWARSAATVGVPRDRIKRIEVGVDLKAADAAGLTDDQVAQMIIDGVGHGLAVKLHEFNKLLITRNEEGRAIRAALEIIVPKSPPADPPNPRDAVPNPRDAVKRDHAIDAGSTATLSFDERAMLPLLHGRAMTLTYESEGRIHAVDYRMPRLFRYRFLLALALGRPVPRLIPRLEVDAERDRVIDEDEMKRIQQIPPVRFRKDDDDAQ